MSPCSHLLRPVAAVSLGLAAVFVALPACRTHQRSNPFAPPPFKRDAVPLPNGSGGIGFDDLGYSRALRKVIAPAGRTGNLALVAPDTREVLVIPGFSTGGPGKGHSAGPTSADEAEGGFLLATDRTAMKIDLVDVRAGAIVASASLSAEPDYVRYVRATHEAFVTEPDREQIEVFSVAGGKLSPSPVATIAVKGGPESLVVDHSRGRAYTSLWDGATVAIELAGRKQVATWTNGCKGSRGLALDEAHGRLFVGCAEGKATVLDVDHGGAQVGAVEAGAGVDVISYSAKLGHLYVPGGKSATMAIVGVSGSGQMSVLGTVATAPEAHCVVADEDGRAWVCDPSHGQLLVFVDSLPPVAH